MRNSLYWESNCFHVIIDDAIDIWRYNLSCLVNLSPVQKEEEIYYLFFYTIEMKNFVYLNLNSNLNHLNYPHKWIYTKDMVLRIWLFPLNQEELFYYLSFCTRILGYVTYSFVYLLITYGRFNKKKKKVKSLIYLANFEQLFSRPYEIVNAISRIIFFLSSIISTCEFFTFLWKFTYILMIQRLTFNHNIEK